MMQTETKKSFTIYKLLAFSFLIFFIVMPQNVWAKTILVTNNAIDSLTCGTKLEPCRSISQAIDNAKNGDHILVGPGRYGDLNHDGDFDDPGEEASGLGFGCKCMILVDKRVSLKSTHGATATILDANNAGLDVVNIITDEVIFGGIDKGFTLLGARMTGDDDGVGLVVLSERNVHIVGNIALDNEDAGFEIHGSRHIIKNNTASRNGSGFVTAFVENGHVIMNNMASANGNASVFGNGFSLSGNNHKIMFNTSTGNKGMGFLLNASNGEKLEFQENNVIGNRGPGIWVFNGPNLVIKKNNIFGNLGEEVFHQSFAPNCGLVNDSDSVIYATYNFWGAPSGHGVDPADNAGPGSNCDRGRVAEVEPFLRKPVKIKSRHR